MTVDCFILQTELDARRRPALRESKPVDVNQKDDAGIPPLLVAVMGKMNANIEILLGLEGIDTNVAARVFVISLRWKNCFDPRSGGKRRYACKTVL
jgi:hypothetical protein